MGKKRKAKEPEADQAEARAKAKADQAEAEVASFHRAQAEEPQPEPALVEKPAPEEEPEAEYPENGYKVAKGRSVSTGGNIIGEGMPIEPADIHANEKVAAENFDAMLNSGLIVEA